MRPSGDTSSAGCVVSRLVERGEGSYEEKFIIRDSDGGVMLGLGSTSADTAYPKANCQKQKVKHHRQEEQEDGDEVCVDDQGDATEIWVSAC